MARIDGDLRKIFRKTIIRAHWKTIETGDTQGGVPDAHVTLDNTSVWVEFKRTTNWRIKFRPMQVGFHLTETRHGGRTIIAIRREYAGTLKLPACDDLYLVDGAAAARLNDEGIQGLVQGDCKGSWTGGPQKWDWAAVRDVLADAPARSEPPGRAARY